METFQNTWTLAEKNLKGIDLLLKDMNYFQTNVKDTYNNEETPVQLIPTIFPTQAYRFTAAKIRRLQDLEFLPILQPYNKTK